VNASTTPPQASHPTIVCVVGAGYVGLTAAACLAQLGHEVRCVETDPHRLALLRRGQVPFHEPGLGELLAAARHAGLLSFGDDIAAGIAGATVALLCVGTPPRPNGEPDLRQLADAAIAIAAAAGPGELTIAVKSTVPTGTCEALELLAHHVAAPGAHLEVASNPEFLRESQAVFDFFHPDRVVIGADSRTAANRLRGLYPDNWPIVCCDRRSAELIKYAANTFLAVKISYANEIAALCEALGADATAVLRGVGLDARIGTAFLRPGPGFGGSCLSKDLAGLIATATAVNCPTSLARSAAEVNARARSGVVDKLESSVGYLAAARIGVLGLAFKPGTDDTRDSPATAVIADLQQRGADVAVYDPLATGAGLTLDRSADPYLAAQDADALVILCGWPEFGDLDPNRLRMRMRGRVVLDTVGIIDIAAFEAAGFEVLATGRGTAAGLTPVIIRPLEWALDVALL
jgi:UDPglucose 6-dehydrogenase